MVVWKKLDLIGKSIVLASICIQLTLMNEFLSQRNKGDLYHLMENQSYISDIIYRHSIGETEYLKFSKPRSKITLWSEWDSENVWSKYLRVLNIAFVSMFVIGSVLSIYARYLELAEQNPNKSSKRDAVTDAPS